VTERLFGRAIHGDYSLLGEEQLQAEIRECGLFRNKSQHIIGTCRVLLADYGGDVPAASSLVRLPGVAVRPPCHSQQCFRPTRHAGRYSLFRVSNRIGLAQGKNPREVEEGLKNVIPRENWSDAHHLLIHHGRQICKARRPAAGIQPIDVMHE